MVEANQAMFQLSDTPALSSMTTIFRKTKKPVQCPKQVAGAFASSVTVQSFGERDWVARKGRSSLFEAFDSILPHVR